MNYTFSGFSKAGNAVVRGAIAAAQDMGHTYVGTEHLLLALARPWPAQTRLIISPVDVPMVDDATVARLLEADGDVVRPTYQGHPGHPILLSAKLIPYL